MWTEKFNDGLCTHFSWFCGLKNSCNSSCLLNRRCGRTLSTMVNMSPSCLLWSTYCLSFLFIRLSCYATSHEDLHRILRTFLIYNCLQLITLICWASFVLSDWGTAWGYDRSRGGELVKIINLSHATLQPFLSFVLQDRLTHSFSTRILSSDAEENWRPKFLHVIIFNALRLRGKPTYYFDHFPPKLHEIENNWTERGRAFLATPTPGIPQWLD